MDAKVYVSCGDVNGIGLRCLAGALEQQPELARSVTLVIDRSVLDQAQQVYGISLPVRIHSIYSPCTITPGHASTAASRLAVMSLETAFTLASTTANAGVTTLPINKHALREVGWMYPGQTEMAQRYASGKALMVLCHNAVRVALCTTHIPLSMIPAAITVESILETVRLFHEHLVHDVGISEPSIAILGLNPHAGEQGMIGLEELDVITPAVTTAIQRGHRVSGPFPADGFFGFDAYTHYDGIVAMYHDQGLIPLKLLSNGNGVNVTAGLSIVRTSPDHGTAYDKASHSVVNPTSLIHALELCSAFVVNRI